MHTSLWLLPCNSIPSHQLLIKGQYQTFQRKNFLISPEYNLSCRYMTISEGQIKKCLHRCICWKNLTNKKVQSCSTIYFSFPFVWEFWNWVCIHFHFCENFQTCLENAFLHETQEKEPHWKHLKMHFFSWEQKNWYWYIFFPLDSLF